MEKHTETTHRNLGFTEEVTACDCCGRTDLKGTYAIEDMQNGGIMYYGCVCAATRMNFSTKQFVSRFKAETIQQEKIARNEYRNSTETTSYLQWINELSTRFDDTTAQGFEDRKTARISEGPAYHQALVSKKLALLIKYPLVKVIY